MKVIVADDDDSMRQVLQDLLSAQDSIDFRGTARDGPGAIALDKVFETALPSDAFRVGGLVVILGWLLALFTSTLTAVGESASTT